MSNNPKKILLIIGHPKSDSFCHALADSFIQGAKENNNEIKNLLCDLKLTFKEFENKILSLRTRLGIDYSLNDFNINNQDLDNISNLVSGNLTNDPFFKDIESIKFILKESMN